MLSSYLKRLRSRRIDGILVVGDDPNRASLVLSEEFSVPVVFASSSATPETDFVVAPNNNAAGRMAAEHLVSLGRRNIAHVTASLGEAAVAARSTGFEDALRAAGLRLAFDSPFFGAYDQSWGMEAARRILSSNRPVDAIFAGNDEIAVGLFSAFHREGIRVPDDIAIVGYDNRLSEVPRSGHPLTSFDPQLSKVGEGAAARLLEVLGGEGEPGIEYVEPELIVGRSSTGPTLEPYDLL